MTFRLWRCFWLTVTHQKSEKVYWLKFNWRFHSLFICLTSSIGPRWCIQTWWSLQRPCWKAYARFSPAACPSNPPWGCLEDPCSPKEAPGPSFRPRSLPNCGWVRWQICSNWWIGETCEASEATPRPSSRTWSHIGKAVGTPWWANSEKSSRQICKIFLHLRHPVLITR